MEQGIQCGAAGTGVQITNTGYLYAENGEFRGSVRAKNIQYGGNDGYFDGGGISGGSIYGNRLVGGTITTAYTSSGINAALNDGTWAANILSGVKDYNVSIRVGTVSCLDLFQNGHGFSMKNVTFKDRDGNNVTISSMTNDRMELMLQQPESIVDGLVSKPSTNQIILNVTTEDFEKIASIDHIELQAKLKDNNTVVKLTPDAAVIIKAGVTADVKAIINVDNI